MGGPGSGRKKFIDTSRMMSVPSVGTDSLVGEIIDRMAARLSPAGADREKLSRAWQWKLDLQDGSKTKDDLIKELGRATGDAMYKPGVGQWAFHHSPARVKQAVGGWRAGKSKCLAAEILTHMFKDNAHCWNVGNDYKLARPEFEYVVEWLRWLDAPIDQISTPATGPWFIKLGWGARLETMSADDIRKLEAARLDACGIAEAGQIQEEVLVRIRGRVAEKRGDILMAGSLEAAEQWYMDAYDDKLNNPDDNWAAFKIPSWENTIIFPGGREDPEIKNLEWSLPEDVFKLKVCAEVAKPQELVFPEFDSNIHLIKFEWTYDITTPEPFVDEQTRRVVGWRMPKDRPVEIAVDPGYAGAYAVLAMQRFDDQIYVIDEVYLRGTVVEDVIQECKSRWWWHKVHSGVIDIAAKQHQGMHSHHEIWADPQYGNIYLQSEFVPIPDGIQRLRTFLINPMNRKPRLWISRSCKGLIEEFRLYRYRQARPNRPEREEPIDANNHSIKALSYYLIGRFGSGDPTRTRVTTQRYIKGEQEVMLENRSRMGTIQHWAMS